MYIIIIIIIIIIIKLRVKRRKGLRLPDVDDCHNNVKGNRV